MTKPTGNPTTRVNVQSQFEQTLKKLTRIGYSLSNIQDLDQLLKIIVAEAIEMLQCDGGSIYLRVKRPEKDKELDFIDDPMVEKGYILIFKESQSKSLSFDFSESVMPVSKRSIAGYVAMTGELLNIGSLYELGETQAYRFNKMFDQSSGYISRTMLAIPMVAHDGEIIGVLSLLNRKRNAGALLKESADFDREVIPFDEHCVELAMAIASQAAVALEKHKLINDIRKLFDSFVTTSVKAIEARDPATGGHSSRVAALSVSLAKAIAAGNHPRFKDKKYTEGDYNEIRKAGLLHDFGKIGVREHVLCKEEKLYPYQLTQIIDRFHFFEKIVRLKAAEEKVRLLREAPSAQRDAAVTALDARCSEECRRFREILDYIIERSKPTFLKPEDKARIEEIAKTTFIDDGGHEWKLLNDDEVANLLIQKGSLNAQERVEIESHVVYSYEFLKKIPWTREYSHLLDYIRHHHENVDGTGYPAHLKGEAVPVEANILHLADIFDALVSTDRPYKPPMPLEKALHILQLEASAGKLDKDLVEIFIESQAYNVIKSRLTFTDEVNMNDGYV